MMNHPFPGHNATLTPQELANILDLVAKVHMPVGITLTQIAPVLQRASMLASLPEGTRIGALPRDPEPVPDVPSGTPAQMELPLTLPPKRRAKPERTVHVH